MSKNTLTSLSKFLSLVLRHQPQLIGLHLDEAGWVGIDSLQERANTAGHALTRELLQQIVDNSDKQRFAISADGLRIRANQGHSVEIELGLVPQVPPARLFHGTASRFLDSILSSGLNKGARHHVHLSTDLGVAGAVGRRYGQLVMLEVDAESMHAHGHCFFRSENGVWLTDRVPPRFLKVLT
ncbi:RNA 2'-phosphotransferase [Inhella sp.]|uniref:RNA 2'-phosphotransferase n=1 Tax=Inhella sp. TaxID=1921806 RepID=UPI0035AFE8BC